MSSSSSSTVYNVAVNAALCVACVGIGAGAAIYLQNNEDLRNKIHSALRLMPGSSSGGDEAPSSSGSKRTDTSRQRTELQVTLGDAKKRVLVLYATESGTTKSWARWVGQRLQMKIDNQVVLGCIEEFDLEDIVDEFEFVFFCIATGQHGAPVEMAKVFSKQLEDASMDFRFGRKYCADMKSYIIGFGDKL